ncbi:MAG: hypothetical protein ACR2JB_04200 [Bryobacteraceae bacterium]
MLVCISLTSFGSTSGGNAAQKISIDKQLQIPGAVLEPGDYTFSQEDMMRDRAIVRIENAGRDSHYLVLSVLNENLPNKSQNGLILFNSNDDKKHVLKGWACLGCAAALEFVYPKLEAVKITENSGESVLAVDPKSDKLPVKLSADDMKIVTLWLLSPKRITADNRGEGVHAAKYEAARRVSEAASAPRSLSQDQPSRLPKTASNTFSLALCGLLAIAAAAGLRMRRIRRG